jgi:N-acetylmuramoyl-L-alanine amidase
MIELPSPNQDDRPGPVDMLILHYTGMQSAQAALARLCDPVAKVSSHYVVDEDGTIYRLVPEQRRAYHAGLSFWRGRRALNDVSVGIEIVNPGHEFGYRAFPAAQIGAVLDLCQRVLRAHDIPARNVVGHSDVAPNRKQDPGELFPWRELATHGVGIWPDVDGAVAGLVGEPAGPLLQDIGYDTDLLITREGLATVTRAFQRHWRPEAVTGLADAGTIGRMCAVLRLC